MLRRNALKYMLLAGVGSATSWLQSKAAPLEAGHSIPEAKNQTNKSTNDDSTTMKVLLVNGSPHKEGCTYTALKEIQDTLLKQNVDSEILHIAAKPVSGCRGCGVCRNTGKCIIDDIVNETIDRIDEFDGFIFGSPVHYASASGFITPFLDRLFYAASRRMAYKPGAAIATCRRAGSTATFDQLNKYFTISNMPIVPSQYWNMVHGFTPDDVRKDEEGLQIMRTLARNMAWMIQCFHIGRVNGAGSPEPEPRVITNFIR